MAIKPIMARSATNAPLHNPRSECNKTDIDEKRNERQLHDPYHNGDNAYESEERKEQAC